jgi:hypothetical protein
MAGWIDRCLDAIADDALVILVGAGASMAKPSRLPAWPGLIERMAEHAAGYQATRATLMREEAAQANLIGASDIYAGDDRVPKVARAEFFRKLFDTPRAAVPDLYRVLADIPARHWATTNFDNNLRFATDSRDVELVSPPRFGNMVSLWSEKQFCVYLHGRAIDYDSLVYRHDHYKVLRENATYRELIKRMFLQSTVLAIGYSFSDPDILETLKYIATDLGGAGARTHAVLTASPDRLPAELLRAVNFEVVQYHADDDHAECITLLRELLARARSVRKGEPRTVSPTKHSELSALVGLYSALYGRDTSAYSAACAALILRATEGSTTHSEVAVVERLGQLAHASIAASKAMLAEGLTVLKATGAVATSTGTIEIKKRPSDGATDLAPVLQAVETRYATFASASPLNASELEKTKAAISYVLLAQGMSVAKAFANQEPPETYSLESIAREAVRVSGVTTAARESLVASLVGVFAEPEPGVSRCLFRLAHSAYALESVFLNPLQSDLESLLHWHVYLDSNVVLRTLSPAVPEHKGFSSLFSRLTKLNTPLLLLHPFATEIVEHARSQGNIVRALKVRDRDHLRSFVADIPKNERSPILVWFLAEVERLGWREFDHFVADVGIDSVASLERTVARYGIKIEGADITRRFDTSTRETLWDALREWRGGGKSISARRLRRNEATQVEYLLRLRDQGIRTWFLSKDGQLRQALKFIHGGRYAGFVITPTAWAHRLADLHWGEVDMAGFSELMWCLPERSPRERLGQIAMRQVLEQAPAGATISPEWLRDQVDAVFTDGSVDSFVQGGDVEQAEAFADLVTQLVPPAVDAILDKLAKERAKK